MNRSLLAAALLLFASPARAGLPHGAAAERGFDATFIQLTEEQLRFDGPAWRRALQPLAQAGVTLAIVQFSGEGAHPYGEAAGTPFLPLTTLLAAAHDEGIALMVGLHTDPRWPGAWPAGALAPPLDDPAQSDRLAAACRAAPAFAGFYIPEEIDDLTFAGAEGAARVHAFLAATIARLHALVPGAPIAIAPFFSATRPPAELAAWWSAILEGSGVDILIVQDGVGTHRNSAATARSRIKALWPVARRLHIRLWCVVEVFDQVSGVPVSDGPFAARAAPVAQVISSLLAERVMVERAVAFAALSYMDPAGGPEQAALYRRYLEWHRAHGTAKLPAPR